MNGLIGSEDALLNFDGWLGKQDDDTRHGITSILNATPETAREVEKKRIASMFAVSEMSGIDLPKVNERWNDVRGGFAEQQGGDWLAVKDDDAKFFQRMTEHATQQRDERHLLRGLDDAEDPKADAARQASLLYRAQEAAYAGQNYGEALTAWEQDVRGKPGYDDARSAFYAEEAAKVHHRTREMLTKVKPIAAQAFDQISLAREGAGGDAAPFALFRGLSAEEKALAFRVMTDEAGKGGADDKSRALAFSEALGRGAENLGIGGGAAAWRDRLLHTKFKAGDMVSEKDAATEARADYTAETVMRSGSGSGGAGAARNARKNRTLTAEEAKAWNEQIAGTIEDLDTSEALRKFGQQVVDPAKAGGVLFQKIVIPAADSAAIMASLAIPGAWAPALELGARSYQNDAYQEFRAKGMEAREANKLALVTGSAQAALDKVSFELLGKFGSKYIPATSRALEQFTMRGSGAARFAANFVGTLGAETVIELAQDHVIPALVQDNLASDPKFDVKWSKVWSEAAQSAPDIMLGMVLLSGLGGIAQTRSQSAYVRELSSSAAAMRLRGYSTEQIAEIQAAPMEARGGLLAEYLPAKAPEGEERTALISEAVALARKEAEAFAEKQRAETTSTAEAANQAIRVTRSGSGWWVTQAGGVSVRVSTAEAAVRIRDDLKQAATEKEAQGFVDLIDQWHAKAPEGATRETSVTGDTVRSDGQTVTRQGLGEVEAQAQTMTPEALDTLREEARMDAQASGHEAIDVAINGSNEVFRQKVADGASQLVQRLEINRGESAVLTFLHESVEADWRAGIASGAISREQTQRAIGALSSVFDPAQARNEEERAFRERVQKVARGEASETELRETLSELAVADALGKRRDGSVMPAGAITAAIDAAIRDQVKPAAIRELGKLRSFLRAVRQYFRALFGTVSALKKARRAGKAAEFDALIAKLTGSTSNAQRQFDTERMTEAQAIADAANLDYQAPSAEEEAAGVAFSLSPAEKTRFAKLASDHEDRAQFLASIPALPMPRENNRIDEPYRGEWKPGGFYKDGYGENQYIYAARDIDPKMFGELLKLEGMDYADVVNMPTTQKYIEWHKAGEVPPPITAIKRSQGVEHEGRYVNSDRRRVVSAIEAGVKTIPAFVEVGRINELWSEARDEVAFRLSAGSRLEAMQNRIDAALSRDPEARRNIARRAIDKLQTLQFNAETLRRTWRGDEIAPIVERRTARELDKEQAVRQALRTDELTEQAMLQLTPETLMALDAGSQKFAEGFLGSTILNEVGRLMSKTEAAKRGLDNAQEYDGAPWLPWQLWGGNIQPDEAAQMLADLGALRDGYPQTLWDALSAEMSSIASANEAFAKAVKAARNADKQARNQAREEAADWRAAQDEMQAKDWSPRNALLRDLRALDAILSVLPPELRGKVGGFVKLASLGSNQARMQEIGRRIEKLSGLLEKHLKKESTEALQTLLEQAAPDREAGKQSKGKIGAEGHRYFDRLAAVLDLTPEEVEAERGRIAALYASPELTTEQAAELFEQEQILDTFGAWKEKTAADMDRALTAARSVYETGRNRWRIVEEERLARVNEMAAQVVAALGGSSYTGIQSQKGRVGNLSLDLKSFAEVLEELLGREHPLAQRWATVARDGFNARNDETRALRKRWLAAVESATGKTGWRARRQVWDMAHEQTITATNEGRLSTSEQSVPIAIIDQWSDGTADPMALGFSTMEAEALIAEREAMAPDDRRQNLPLNRSSRAEGEAVPMTEAEAIFVTMLGAQEQYAEALDRAGWTAEALAKLEDQLSEPAKKLREFMRNEYRDGYGPLAATFERMYGVALPQIRNYAPAAFYHTGAERETGPEERGGIGAGMRAGFLKNRKNHKAMPRLENAFAAFHGHAAQTAHWKGLAEFVREFSGVIGKPEVKAAIEARHGAGMLKTLNDWTRNIEGNGLQTQSGLLDKVVGWLASQQAYIALAYNVGTLAKQSTALLGAAYRMPAGAYARGFARLVSGQLDTAAMWNHAAIQRRLETGFAPEVRAALDDIWNAKPSRRAAMLERGMELIGLTDAIFTTGSAAIAYDYHHQAALDAGLTGGAAHEAAMREVEDIVARTEQPADAVNRSLFEARQGAFGRLLFMFASEARQKSSLWVTAWQRTLTGAATAEDYRVLALAHLVVAPMLQAITATWRDLRDDDDDELFDSKNWNAMDFVKASVLGPLSGIPLVSDALSGFPDNGIFGRQIYAFAALKQLFTGPKENEAEKLEWYVKRVLRIMQGADAFTGVAGKVGDQAFSVADNLLPDSESEAAKKERAAARREIKDARE